MAEADAVPEQGLTPVAPAPAADPVAASPADDGKVMKCDGWSGGRISHTAWPGV